MNFDGLENDRQIIQNSIGNQEEFAESFKLAAS